MSQCETERNNVSKDVDYLREQANVAVRCHLQTFRSCNVLRKVCNKITSLSIFLYHFLLNFLSIIKSYMQELF